MIRYALICDQLHEFEAWFSSSDDFDVQQQQHLVECPYCQSVDVRKQIMAPALGKRKPSPEQQLAEYASKVREEIRTTHTYVGDEFASKARAMHLGDAPKQPIYGEVSVTQAKSLHEDGIPAEPLPEPFSPGKPKITN
ncbi:MAG: DUF1178 family protein [Robiginitomaculum sp.]|nr:DUF1178 family protein [Robiginitomaculum sp.]